MKTVIFCFFALSVFTTSQCGSEVPLDFVNERIIGGIPVQNINEASFQVVITHVSTKSLKCGGVLIKKDLVVTSAQCLLNGNKATDIIKADSIQIRAGSLNIQKPTQTSDAKWVRVHDCYTSQKVGNYNKLSNNIGLIKLKSNFKLNKQVQIIALRNTPVPSGKQCTVTGFGQTLQADFSQMLLKTSLITIDTTMCDTAYKANGGEGIPSGTICANATGAGSCTGDNGGPMICDGFLSGIISYGFNCGGNLPDVLTDVYQYRDWINLNSATTLSSSAFLLTLIFQIIRHLMQ